MSEQRKIRISTDPNKPGAHRLQQEVDRIVADNLDELNAMQREAGMPLLAEPAGEG